MPRRSRQFAFDLRARPTWGGRRDGAGRKRGPNFGLPHASRKRFTRLPVHVTLRMRDDVPSLRSATIVHAIERTFAAGCARPGFRLVHYSLQSNHAHLIVEAVDRDALGRGMKAIGARLARAVNRVAERSGRVLVDRYHHNVLATPRQVRNALRYVLLNARRHAGAVGTKLIGAVRLDPASSARWFDGWKKEKLGGIVPEGTERALARSPVARARTWLLAVGWRRWGLLDPAEVPG